jgi:hypothetical protein
LYQQNVALVVFWYTTSLYHPGALF